MTDQATAERALPYLINDADEHSTPSRHAYERYIDPDKRDMAIRYEKAPTAGPRSGTTGARPGSPTATSRSSVPTTSSPRSA